jgi:hypothetical protein
VNNRKHPGGYRSSKIKLTLQTRFLEELNKDFEEHGLAVIRIVRVEQPAQYLKIIASVLPQELLIQEGALEQMSDEELLAALQTIKQLRTAEKQQIPPETKLH